MKRVTDKKVILSFFFNVVSHPLHVFLLIYAVIIYIVQWPRLQLDYLYNLHAYLPVGWNFEHFPCGTNERTLYLSYTSWSAGWTAGSAPATRIVHRWREKKSWDEKSSTPIYFTKVELVPLQNSAEYTHFVQRRINSLQRWKVEQKCVTKKCKTQLFSKICNNKM